MRRQKKPTARFWAVLCAVNVLVLAYPFSPYFHAGSDDSKLIAAFALILVVFVLLIADSVSALLEYSL